MGGQSAAAFVVVCLVAAVLSPTAVEGQLIVIRYNLTDTFCCSANGACTPGAAGLANVTGVLSCVNPITGVLTELGRGVSNANGTLNIVRSVPLILGTAVVSRVPGTAVPCALTNTFALVNQTTCPVINVLNATVVRVPTMLNTTLTTRFGRVLTGRLGVLPLSPA